MRMIREILRLYYHRGLSQKKISNALGCARSSVGEYIRRAQAAGISWPLPPEFDDENLLEKHIFGPPPEKRKAQPDCPYIHIELKKKGVSLELLWHEYKELNPDGYQQTQFCNIYRTWRKTAGLVMRQEHKAGQKAFSDFAGTTLPIRNSRTNEVTQAHRLCCKNCLNFQIANGFLVISLDSC